MSFPGLAPPPFFLATPGRPPLPWEQWEQMFNVYLVASGAAEFTPERRKAILLHCLGPEGQRIYQTLPAGSTAAAPAVPSAAALAVKDGDKSVAATSDEYDTALVALRHHFSTSSNVVVERHRFHRRRQHSGESVHDFVAALRELASHCSFVSQDDALRDQIVAGIASKRPLSPGVVQSPVLQPTSGTQSPSSEVLQQPTSAVQHSERPTRKRRPPAWLQDYETNF
ncbi:hypothetical protein MTO96_018369 [Rhipicephalus appendiculatus]